MVFETTPTPKAFFINPMSKFGGSELRKKMLKKCAWEINKTL